MSLALAHRRETDAPSVASPDDFTITPLTGTIGAEIAGLDLRQPIVGARPALIAALDEYGVIFFTPQAIDENHLVQLAATFGPVVPPINPSRAAPRTEVKVMISTPQPWHADTTWEAAPTGEQAFQVLELPPTGGDTVWASTRAAYDSLSRPIRDLIDPLRAVHDDSRVPHYGAPIAAEELAARQPAEHPVVRVHPRSGRRSLFVNPLYTSHIVGLSEAESRHLLALLYDQVLRPEHQVRYRWSKGSVAVWDNRTTWHYAVGDYGSQARRVQRVSTRGEVPIGAASGADAESGANAGAGA